MLRYSLALVLFAAPVVMAAPGERLKEHPPVQQLAGLIMGVVLIALVVVGILAVLLLYGVLAPRQLQVGDSALRQHPLRCLGRGLLLLAVGIGALILAGALPESIAGLVALPVLLLIAVPTVIGFAMVGHHLGDRLAANLNSRAAGSPARTLLLGGLLLILVGLLPIAGQLIQFAAWLFGLGAAITTYWPWQNTAVAEDS